MKILFYFCRLVPTTTIIKLILSNVYSNDQIDKVDFKIHM